MPLESDRFQSAVRLIRSSKFNDRISLKQSVNSNPKDGDTESVHGEGFASLLV